MSTCNRLDLQTLGSPPIIMPKISIPDHCLQPCVFGIFWKSTFICSTKFEFYGFCVCPCKLTLPRKIIP